MPYINVQKATSFQNSNNVDKHTLTQLSFSTKYQSSTTINIVSTLIWPWCVCRVKEDNFITKSPFFEDFLYIFPQFSRVSSWLQESYLLEHLLIAAWRDLRLMYSYTWWSIWSCGSCNALFLYFLSPVSFLLISPFMHNVVK